LLQANTVGNLLITNKIEALVLMGEIIQQQSRRAFLRKMALGAGGLLLAGNFGFSWMIDPATGKIKAIVIDFSKCTGCRTCETVCAGFHNQFSESDVSFPGITNPYKANIRVHHYNPDVDVPLVCSRCDDAPCIEACPIDPDPLTGRKALYRHPETGVPTNDKDRCIGCRMCARTCAKLRTGTIRPNEETDMPEGICDLCGGDPQCAKYCPFGAIDFIEVAHDREYAGISPEAIGQLLIKKYYAF